MVNRPTLLVGMPGVQLASAEHVKTALTERMPGYEIVLISSEVGVHLIPAEGSEAYRRLLGGDDDEA